MNHEKIKEFAWVAGLVPDKEPVAFHNFLQESQIYKFAYLLAAYEREACAQVCEKYVNSPSDHEAGTAMNIQDLIRARGQS